MGAAQRQPLLEPLPAWTTASAQSTTSARVRQKRGKDLPAAFAGSFDAERGYVPLAGISATDDLRRLSEERIAEARALLGGGHFSGAYYLAGYGVELGLKAVLTQDLASHVLPEKRDVEAAHTHELRKLASKAGVEPDSDPAVRVAWNVVVNWGPDARYREHAEARAREMVDSAEEMVKWLKPLW